MKLDMYEVLSRWGVWARESSGVDYPPIAAGFKGLLPPANSGKESCNDDDGLLIDGCVARLKKYKPDEYDLVIVHHVYGVSLRKIARIRRCSDGTIRKEMQIAEGFIMGILCMLNVQFGSIFN
ncbi:antitermination protein [Serratia marcescens]|uniref:antiterminator Q family protein n=1 Tax=Serratia nevei TaxID=2703794 RepID=UPI001A262F55|nr:antitermination protein [Serratia marcescens]ELQ9441954.1 antitermination protein [Serratia marcescens]ELT5562480.1 antitermination protein [Serratia marcescens]HAT4993756.1 antitermination protein [Serratia marcescens]